jgi:hypothetical protein
VSSSETVHVCDNCSKGLCSLFVTECRQYLPTMAQGVFLRLPPPRIALAQNKFSLYVMVGGASCPFFKRQVKPSSLRRTFELSRVLYTPPVYSLLSGAKPTANVSRSSRGFGHHVSFRHVRRHARANICHPA